MAEKLITFTLQKARFFDSFRDRLNDRQLTVVRRVLQEGPGGFTRGRSTSYQINPAHFPKQP